MRSHHVFCLVKLPSLSAPPRFSLYLRQWSPFYLLTSLLSRTLTYLLSSLYGITQLILKNTRDLDFSHNGSIGSSRLCTRPLEPALRYTACTPFRSFRRRLHPAQITPPLVSRTFVGRKLLEEANMLRSPREANLKHVEKDQDISQVDPWVTIHRTIRDREEDKVQDCKEDMDTLLVFAGLYSAVLTSFVVQSYQSLQEDPQQTSVVLLRQITSQTSSYTLSNGSLNSTAPRCPLPPRSKRRAPM
ncbi:hypothetical protein NM688_g3170 [Phlebia brevispora]|uniref:Uncharacterized protein n=1 Tax=Phlebia brevispora TaxID=194682 RepID=A0ACC1T6F2_9APHY|nr:hypothetical protein NM688_g3170 [Phlebia brevispora]